MKGVGKGSVCRRSPSRLGLLTLAAALATIFVLALPGNAAAAKYTLTVKKTGTVGTSTVKCEVAGSGEIKACASSYLEETELVLYATPSSGLIFAGWQDEYCSFYEAEPCELRMEEPVAVVAEFGPIPKYPLKIETKGSGTGKVECEAAGSGTRGSCASAYTAETELVLYATPSAGSTFVGWTDEYCFVYGAEPCELTFEEESITVAPEFNPIPKYPLTIEAKGSGTGTVKCEVAGSGTAGACASTYPAETELNLYAVADSGSEFVEWSGACVFNANCSLTIEEEATVVAIFKARPQVPFSVVKAGTGSGTVTCDGGPCASSYSEGREVTLVATAAPGSTFAGWSGAGCSGTGSCKVAIKAGITVAATFNANPTPQPLGIARASAWAPVSGRYATLKLICSGGPCEGVLKLSAKLRQGGTVRRVTIGKTSFSLASGASKMLRVRLSAAARKELEKRGALKAKLTGAGAVASTIRLKLRR